MCQPQSEGGRRCPIHQPATLGLKKALTTQYGLNDEQVSHTFRSLCQQGAGRPAPTPEEYAYFIERQKQILARTTISDTAKNAALRQFNKPLDENQLPDGPTFYALKKFRPRAREQKAEFVQLMRQIANHHGINRNQAFDRFKEAFSRAEGGNVRDNALDDTFDQRTRAAVSSLLSTNNDANSGADMPEFSTEPRITRQDFRHRSNWIRSIGYDPDDGRLEIETDAGVYPYHNVSAAQWQHIQDNVRGAPSYISREIMRNSTHAYATPEEGERDAYGRYCQDCHKYRAISGHTCDFSAREAREAEVDMEQQINEAFSGVEEAEDASSKISYEKALEEIKAALRAENEANAEEEASEDAAEEEAPARRTRRPRTGPTARQRRWMTPVEERETVRLDSDEEQSSRRYGPSFSVPNARDLKKEVISNGKIVEFDIKESYTTYTSSGYQRFVVSQTVKVHAEGENGDLKFERSGNLKCNCPDYQANYDCEHLRSAPRHFGLSNQESWAQTRMNLVHEKISPNSFVRSRSLDENGEMRFSFASQRRRRRGVHQQGTRLRSDYDFTAAERQEVQRALAAGRQVVLNFEDYHNSIRSGYYHQLNGEVTLRQDEENGVHVTSNNLVCSRCRRHTDTGDCEHQSNAGAYVVGMVNNDIVAETHNYGSSGSSEPAIDYANLSVEERLEKLNEATNDSWLANPEAVETMRSTFSDPAGIDNSYGSNLDKYLEDYRDAEAKVEAGESPIPFVTENATNGACTPESGRAFGVEIEFDIKYWVNTSEAIRAIGRDMKAAGLTDSENQQRYHANRTAANPYSQWTLESDCTVAAEIVSPKLYDRPEDWEQIRKVCEIVKRHGGTATTRTGGHVHMGLGSGSPSEVARRKVGVTQIYSAYQDSMRRAQANPVRKTHRASNWTSPLDSSSAQSNVYAIREGRRVYEDHHTSLNLGHEGRVEFRGADGSLDPAHIQAQVVIAAGIVRAAEKGEVAGDNLHFSKVGENSKKTKLITKGAKRKLTDNEVIVTDVEMRDFADNILGYEHGRKVMTSIAANTPWQEK